MPIYIDNTQPAGRRGIALGQIVLFLFTTKTGLVFVLSQILPIIAAFFQNWNIGVTVFYYYVYSLIIVLGSAFLALVWQPADQNTESVIYNGAKTIAASRGCNYLFIIGWFAPAIFYSLFLLPFVITAAIGVSTGLLAIYEGVLYQLTFYRIQRKSLALGLTQMDLARAFTTLVAPYLRLGALGAIVTTSIFAFNPLQLLFIIVVTECLIYGLQNAPGAVPLTVKTTENN